MGEAIHTPALRRRPRRRPALLIPPKTLWGGWGAGGGFRVVEALDLGLRLQGHGGL